MTDSIEEGFLKLKETVHLKLEELKEEIQNLNYKCEIQQDIIKSLEEQLEESKIQRTVIINQDNGYREKKWFWF